MQRVSDPQPSPKGERIAFVVRATDLEANRGRTDLWLVNADGGGLTRLTDDLLLLAQSQEDDFLHPEAVQLPDFVVASDIRAGRLVSVLDEFRVQDRWVHAVFPPGRYLPTSVRAFVDFFADRFGQAPPWLRFS